MITGEQVRRLKEKLQYCPIDGEIAEWPVVGRVLGFLDLRHRLCKHGFYSVNYDVEQPLPWMFYSYRPAHIRSDRTWSIDLKRMLVDFKFCSFCKRPTMDRDGLTGTLACREHGIFKMDSITNTGEVVFLIKPFSHVWPDLLR